MRTFRQMRTIIVKELRELLSRPWQVITLILGPLIIMVCFGLGSDANPRPPTTIVVVPPGQAQPRLLQDYQNQFDQFLAITEYTEDEAYARGLLQSNHIDAVVVLPVEPFKKIMQGEQAVIQVLYNQINPIWSATVPNFTHIMASTINHEIFLQTMGEQQGHLETAARDIDLIITALELAILAADDGDRAEVRDQLRAALARHAAFEQELAALGPEASPMRSSADQLRQRLERAERALEDPEEAPTTLRLSEELGLSESLARVRQMNDTIERFLGVSPEVVITPLVVRAENVAIFEPDIVTFFAPSILALLIQHIAVSMGALGLVRERLSGVFDLYAIAPTSAFQLLLGKYLAYLLFTLVLGGITTLVLLKILRVPLLGSPWQLALVLLLLSLGSVGLGFLFSLIASSERQAVQLSMLSLLGVVFFSGITLPLDALRQPALSISYALPATYGVSLLQDVMLRGRAGTATDMLVLGGIGALLFMACLALLRWRIRPR